MACNIKTYNNKVFTKLWVSLYLFKTPQNILTLFLGSNTLNTSNRKDKRARNDSQVTFPSPKIPQKGKLYLRGEIV